MEGVYVRSFGYIRLMRVVKRVSFLCFSIKPFSQLWIDYMNGFRCKVTNATSAVALAKPAITRRCGEDHENNKQFSAVQNCTYGAKQPLYWLNDNSNMFEGEHAPPVYNDLYNFADGAQNDIFEDSYKTLPQPGVVAALPVLARDKGLVPRPLKNNEGSNVPHSEDLRADPRLFRRYVPRYLTGVTYPSKSSNSGTSGGSAFRVDK